MKKSTAILRLSEIRGPNLRRSPCRFLIDDVFFLVINNTIVGIGCYRVEKKSLTNESNSQKYNIY